ncbi:MAG TPA: 5-formyltetrahydrofolate cyclo-ligase [Noviherbaspirillum sp.]
MQNIFDKATLRQQLLAQRQRLAPEVRADFDAAIEQQILKWWQAARPLRMAVFWPMRGEPDLRRLYTELAAAGAALALPAVVEKNAGLVFRAWEPGDRLERDALEVVAPAAAAETVRPDAVLIPCVGFNSRKQRLGYGGGYYDRTLAMTPRPFTIGIAYASSACEFEGDAHDIALDRIVTEQA